MGRIVELTSAIAGSAAAAAAMRTTRRHKQRETRRQSRRQRTHSWWQRAGRTCQLCRVKAMRDGDGRAASATVATTPDMSLGLFGVDLDQAIHELATLQQRLHADILIQAVNVAEVRADKYLFDAISRNSR